MERQPQAYCNDDRHHRWDSEEKHPGENRVDDECYKKGSDDRSNLRGAGSRQRAELPEHHGLQQFHMNTPRLKEDATDIPIMLITSVSPQGDT
jgi:hypothetical protein